MNYNFKERYNELIKKDRTDKEDLERKSFYNKLSNKELLNLYLEERELLDFINLKIFEILVEKNLLLKGKNQKDLLEKSYNL